MMLSKPLAATALLLLFSAATARAQSDASMDSIIASYMVDVGFVIVYSTPDYSVARRMAQMAAQKLDVNLDLRGLIHDPRYGLTFPDDSITCDIHPFPSYAPRGRFDAGSYVSIEQSDGYPSFAPGYFIVVVYSGWPGESELSERLASTRRAFPDAYARIESVYHGCMH